VWQTLNIDEDVSAKAAKTDGRTSALEFLRKTISEVFAALGKTNEEAGTVAETLEAAIFDITTNGEVSKRKYQAEVQRLCAAFRQETFDNAKWLQDVLTNGRRAAVELVELPPEELLLHSKRARLAELRQMPPQESGEAVNQFTEVDERLECVDCGCSGEIRFRRLASSREGFNK
ncbi:unnamed protein product, partial [Cladocopium goreaui]